MNRLSIRKLTEDVARFLFYLIKGSYVKQLTFLFWGRSLFVHLAFANPSWLIIFTSTKATINRTEFSTAIHSSMQFMVIWFLLIPLIKFNLFYLYLMEVKKMHTVVWMKNWRWFMEVFSQTGVVRHALLTVWT